MPSRLLAVAIALAVALALAACGSGGSDEGGGTDGEQRAEAAEHTDRRVPMGFMGMAFDGPLLDPDAVDAEAEVRTMTRSGVETMRLAIDWSATQAFESVDDVPPALREHLDDVEVVDGVPTNFAAVDRAVELAARHGIDVLPHAVRTPRWAALDPDEPSSPPADPESYAAFMAALVERYGPDGSFWADRPDLPKRPITDWQIWNEPDQADRYWSVQPFAESYVDLLRASRRAIHEVDPDARIVLAGLVGESWKHLEQVYEVPGAREAFDVVAIHPYTERVSNVVKILDLGRGVMRRNGDEAKPLVVTELTWPSAQGHVEHYGYETTPEGQARKLREAYAALADVRERLRLELVVWYTWLTRDEGTTDPFAYSGLRRLEGHRAVPKPAFAAYEEAARRLEGCAKGDLATECR